MREERLSTNLTERPLGAPRKMDLDSSAVVNTI